MDNNELLEALKALAAQVHDVMQQKIEETDLTIEGPKVAEMVKDLASISSEVRRAEVSVNETFDNLKKKIEEISYRILDILDDSRD